MVADCEKDRLLRIFRYDPTTGVFRRTESKGRWKAGQIAGTQGPQGYVFLNVAGKLYRAHRLAWLHFYGEWPKLFVDHINGVRHDNRIANLRQATNAENLQNSHRPRSQNRSGFLGVVPNRKRWAAQIMLDGKTTCLGTYDAPEEAHAAYIAAKARMHPFQQLADGRRLSDRQAETLDRIWERVT
jgi:hypothetical protein